MLFFEFIWTRFPSHCSVLKKCGKKMPRYCDVNNDKRITLSEWMNCLQVQTNVQKSKATEMSKSVRAFSSSFQHHESSYSICFVFCSFHSRSTAADTKCPETKRTESTRILSEKWLIFFNRNKYTVLICIPCNFSMRPIWPKMQTLSSKSIYETKWIWICLLLFCNVDE